jgi:hypothetical protein
MTCIFPYLEHHYFDLSHMAILVRMNSKIYSQLIFGTFFM